MAEIHHDLPPSCPDCAGATALKEVFKNRSDGYTFFFKCLSCALEYPRAVARDKIEFAIAAGIRIPGLGNG